MPVRPTLHGSNTARRRKAAVGGAIAVCIAGAGALFAGVAPAAVITHLATAALAVGALLATQRWWQPDAADGSHGAQPPVDENVADTAKQIAALKRTYEAVDAAGLRVFEWDLTANRLAVDPRRLALYSEQAQNVAASPGGFTGLIVHEADLPRFRSDMREAIKFKKHFVVSCRVLHGDGATHAVQLHGQVFRGADGRATRVLGISVDLTEEVAATQVIRANAREQSAVLERLNLAIEAAGIGIWDWDLVTNRIGADNAMSKTFGGLDPNAFPTPQEFVRKHVYAEDLPAFERVLGKALRYGTALEHDYRSMLADGSLRHTQLHGRIFRDADKQATRFLGVTIDTTRMVEAAQTIEERSRHERELRERLNLATRVGGIGIWDWDVVADRMTIDALIGQSYGVGATTIEKDARAFFTRVVVPEERELLASTIDQALASGDTLSHRYWAMLPVGGLRHVQINARVLRDGDGRALSMLGVTMDITDATKRTQQLEQQAQQERALRDRLNLATHTAGIGVWDMDMETRQIVADATVRQLLKFDGPLDQATMMRRIHAEDRATVLRSIGLAIADPTQDGIVSVRHRLKHSTATTQYVQTHIRVFRNADSSAQRILGVTWDVSAQVEHATQLQQQAEHVQALLDRLSVASKAAGISPWEMDLHTNRFLWVENCLPGFGLPDVPLEQFGTALFKVVHPDDLAEMMVAGKQAIANGAQTYSYRFRVVRPDGTERHMQTYAHVIRDEHGVAQRLLGATIDVTNEVQTTALLQRQAEQERALVERLNMATDVAGICSWEIDLLARCFIWVENSIPGLESSGAQGRALEVLSERMLAEDRNNFEAAINTAVKSRSSHLTSYYRATTNEGKLIHVQTKARLIFDDAGRPIRALGVSWDVTREIEDARRLEEQAQQQRVLLERLTLASESAGISSFEVDLASGVFLWSENPLQSLAKLELQGTSIEAFSSSMIMPEDRTVFRDAIWNALVENRNGFSCRYRGIGRDGNIVYVQTQGRFVPDKNGRTNRLLGVSWDVTAIVETGEQLKRQAKLLQDAEHRLERASLSSSEGHWEWDFRNDRAWYSTSCHTLLGYQQGELPSNLRASLRAMQHPDDVTWQSERFKKHVRHGEPYDFECRLRLNSGEYRWFRVRGAAERDASGAPIAMAGSMQDIHQQKLAEDALKLAQRRFERAINGTQDGLWELEADGTAWCSPRLGELLGFRAEEFPSSTNFLRMHLHPEDATAVAVATQAHFQQEVPYDVEIRLRTRSGVYRWYRARAIAERDANGRPLRMSGSLQDVTEARAAHEELVRATEAAEAASRSKSEFLANVSHEIRTPMNGIIGMTGLLIDTALDRTQRDYAETIRGSADSLLIVINDILDFSKIEAGKLSIDSLEVDLRSSVEDVGSMMAFQASSKSLELVMHVHPDLPDRVLGDPQRIRQCLINLVGNAIKFTRVGEIVLEVRQVGSRDGKILAQFEVRDTGIGIAPEVLQTLFQPFVQADSSTTRHFGGTGLGLSIVRRLVEMMGGAVGLESEVGKGSVFWFTLPLEPLPSPPRILDAGNLARLGNRILIVDDNETNRRVLAGQLLHAGYEITLAGGGNEAVQILNQGASDQHPYDIVLADYQMHDMDGATLGERINADPKLSRARIVILTSLDRHGDIRRFASMGFAGYLTKPVRSRDLIECVDRLLSRDAKEWHLQSQPIVTNGMLAALEKSQRYRGQVLLVEDNPVNQKVAVRYLERMGCQVRVADNGAEGVKAYKEEGKFDIVLMDLQMPIMDGLTATREIRKFEGGRAATPIVALTANAMSGQLERCLEAGMNAFLTKPLEIERLHEALRRFGLADDHAADAVEPASATAAPVDLARLHEITDGDAEFTYELASTFISSGYQVIQEIADALSVFDRPALARAAHKLKGASANIHATNVCDLAHTLETLASSVDQPRLKELVERLHQAFVAAADFLQEQAPQPAAKAG